MLLLLLIVVYMSLETHLFSIDTIFRGWYVGRAIPSLPFFCFGLFLKEQKLIPKNVPPKCLFAMAVVIIIIPLFNGFCSINGNEFGYSYVLFLLNAIVSTLFLFSMSSRIPFIKPFTTFSKGTLLILGLHIPILHFLEMVFPSCFREYLPLAVFLICYFPIIWIEKFCPELLGKVRWKCIT